MEIMEGRALVALQGPKAAEILQKFIATDLTKMAFMSIADLPLTLGFNAIISRCGYTGEDGFEISVAPENAVALCDALFADEKVAPAGLASRDSLRLEAGLCLHGNDMSAEITPIEALLMWTVRKQNISTPHFGQEALAKFKADKSLKMRRFGFKLVGKGVARAGMKIFKPDGKEIGHVTSGTFSKKTGAIGMGYVKKGNTKAGKQLFVEIRGKKVEIVTAKPPFVTPGYYRGA